MRSTGQVLTPALLLAALAGWARVATILRLAVTSV